MTSRELLALAAIGAPAATALALAVVPRRLVGHVADLGAALSAIAAGALAVVALAAPGSPLVERWLVVDAAAGLFVAVIGAVGLASVVASDSYLSSQADSLVRAERRARAYYGLLFGFWAILAAVPVIGNLAGAWLLVEATTAASALLVGFSGRPRALEAGWKYLILTSLGLGVALLGIVALAARSTAGGLDALSWRELSAVQTGSGDGRRVPAGARRACVEDRLGPVHNWLPDAHSEAPAPVSALLSAALLPTVLLVAWRSSQALEPVLGAIDHARGAGRLRPALAGRRGAVPLAPAAVETAARLLEPGAHGRDRARDRLRNPTRTRRRRRPHRRPRGRKGARLLRRNAAARARPARGPPRKPRRRSQRSPGSVRCSAAPSRPSPGFRPRRSSSAR